MDPTISKETPDTARFSTLSRITGASGLHAESTPRALGTEITHLPIKWLRVPDAVKYSGLSRSLLYRLMAEGQIKSVCVRKRGNTRGARLLSAESIDAFIESYAQSKEVTLS
jgi:hypothetical protein